MKLFANEFRRKIPIVSQRNLTKEEIDAQFCYTVTEIDKFAKEFYKVMNYWFSLIKYTIMLRCGNRV